MIRDFMLDFRILEYLFHTCDYTQINPVSTICTSGNHTILYNFFSALEKWEILCSLNKVFLLLWNFSVCGSTFTEVQFHLL